MSDSTVSTDEGPLGQYIESYEDLEVVNHRLCLAEFLRDISPSQLPSNAISEESRTPADEDPFKDSKAFIEAWQFAMSIDRSYGTVEHNHGDTVLAVDFNAFGTRMVTASADHKLRVWDKAKDDSWTVTDAWKAHDAEIVDVKWNGPFLGHFVGSIGEDGLFILWQEDVLEIPKSGRRFKRIYTQKSATRVPFMSLAFMNMHTETYVALVTRDGYMMVLEPVNIGELTNWQSIHSRNLCLTPPRDDETGFKVCFHNEQHPSFASIMGGADQKCISLAAAAMDVVKIFRTDKDRRFYLAAELTGARDIIRDVAWSNGSVRGFDILATASKDGCIRFYELHTEKSRSISDGSTSVASPEPTAPEKPNTSSRQAISGIGAGLAGSSEKQSYRDPEPTPGRPIETATMVTEINPHSGHMWGVEFSRNGDMLISTGDDGLVRAWKRHLNGQWIEYADVNTVGEQA